MTAKEALRELVGDLTEEESEMLLTFYREHRGEEELSDAEIDAVLRGRAEFERGEYITQADFEAKYGL